MAEWDRLLKDVDVDEEAPMPLLSKETLRAATQILDPSMLPDDECRRAHADLSAKLNPSGDGGDSSSGRERSRASAPARVDEPTAPTVQSVLRSAECTARRDAILSCSPRGEARARDEAAA